MSYYLFLDDLRMPKDAWIYPRRDGDNKLLISNSLEEVSGVPNGSWEIVRSYDEFIKILNEKGLPDIVSFDHDLAEEHVSHYFKHTVNSGVIEYGNFKEKTGKHCAEYLLDKWRKSDKLKTPKIIIHSANQYGVKNIKETLKELL